MSNSELDSSPQDKERLIQEAIESWNKFFTERIGITVVGNSCCVDCRDSALIMKNMIGKTNVIKINSDFAVEIVRFFLKQSNIYPITLGVKKIDAMGYRIKSFGPVIEDYETIESNIQQGVDPFTGKWRGPIDTISTFRPYPSGFLCIVEKASPK